VERLSVSIVLTEGLPARRSLPSLMGRTIPGFLLAGGRDKLLGGSPEATLTVWLLYTSSRVMVSSFTNLISVFLSFFFAYSILKRKSTKGSKYR